MGSSMRAMGPRETWIRSANDRWKARWSAWVLRSTIAGAAVHAVIFAVWPLWDITYLAPERLAEMIQLNPIMSVGTVGEPEESALAAVPETEDDEFGVDEGGAGVDEEDLEIFNFDEVFGDELRPVLAYPVLPTGVYGRPAPPDDDGLILDRLSIVRAQVIALSPSVVWPKIRNPTVILRYLRNRYDAVRRDPSASGIVSVAMWIDDRGSVEWAQVSTSSGHPGLDAIALAVFNDVVVFTPARNEGDAVPLGVEITIPFTLPW